MRPGLRATLSCAAAVLSFLLASLVTGLLASGFHEPGSDSVLAKDSRLMLLMTMLSWLLACPLLLGPCAALAGLSRAGLGLSVPLSAVELLRGVLLGLLVFAAPAALGLLLGAWVELPAGSVQAPTGLAASGQLVLLMLALGVAAFGEELLCRGLFQSIFEGLWGARVGILVSTLLFSFMHGANPGISALGVAGIALWGLLLGVVFATSRSLLLVSGLHFGWNFAVCGLMGLPVSGHRFAAVSRWESGTDGALQLFFGGTFGPEEGLCFHLAILLALGLALRAAAPIARTP
tara:strand:- start:330 stop:1202 length:873 start_codon:yes stop_codon:yes gene_type:complete